MRLEGAFGADVSDDSARRNARPEISCQDGNYAPVRLWQMKWPCAVSDKLVLVLD